MVKLVEPLAFKLRPQDLDSFVGQVHLVGKDGPLRVAIKNRHLFSMIFWGPPGVGKTTLAKIYANSLNADLYEISAVSSGKDDLREIVSKASKSKNPTLLFLDEIHRFNKAQQDYLLPFVESGTITLVGSTTENPSFEVIAPLLSRCKVFILNKLSFDELKEIIDRASKELKVPVENDAKEWLINMSDGDARQAITYLENTSRLYKKVTTETLENASQSRFFKYDKNGEQHYNTISAFIKSMRAGDASAALYYMARMIASGENPLFIARRMVIFASEDIGIAKSTALIVANEVFKACEVIGYPECAINLAHGAVFLSKCPKDRRAYDALQKAKNDLDEFGDLPIPLNLRNAPTKFMKDIGYGSGYKMYDKESLMPDKLKGRKYI